jgi:hypothetical protein
MFRTLLHLPSVVADYTVGGVKKTGEGVKKAGTAIGRTIGKVGGIF